MRPHFTNRSIALLRNMNKRNLTDLATIWWMKPGTRDVSGDYPETKEIVQADQPCRLSPLDLRVPFEASIAEQFGTDAKWIVIFEAGYFVPSNRRLFVTGTTVATAWELHLEVLGEIFTHNEMYHRVACASLSNVKAQQFYA